MFFVRLNVFFHIHIYVKQSPHPFIHLHTQCPEREKIEARDKNESPVKRGTREITAPHNSQLCIHAQEPRSLCVLLQCYLLATIVRR
jgi:hypothetical protein